MVKAMKKVLVCAMAAALTVGSAQAASAATASPGNAPKPVAQSGASVKIGKVDTKANGTAVLASAKNSKSVTVPAKVTVKGVGYKVTVIKANAFKNCKKTTKVTLPNTIKTISKNAFAGAKKLKTIVLKGKKAITVKKGAFKGLNTKKITIQAKKMSKKDKKNFKKALKKAGFKGKVK